MTRALAALAVACLVTTGAASQAWARANAEEGTGTETGIPTVTVFRPAGAGETLVEVAMRTRAELVAGGFSASIVECAMTSGKCRAAGGGGPRATVATFEYAGETLTEVTTSPGAQAATFKIVRAEAPGTEPKVLAIRAVELLRAALLDPVAALAAETKEPAAPPVVVTLEDDEAPARRERAEAAPPAEPVGWAVAVGGTMLQSTGEVGNSYGLLVRAGYFGRTGAGLSVVFAAVELTPDVPVAEGTVSLHQELGQLEGSYRFRVDRSLQPYVTVGLGGYHLGARGNVVTNGNGPVFTPVEAPINGRSADGWEIVASGGVGVQVVGWRGFGCLADARAMVAGPQITLADAAFVRLGGPLLMLSLAVQKVF